MSDLTWLDRTQYPFASHDLTVPAGRLHYVDEGAGSPIVMVHGNPAWSFLYRYLISGLSDRYRCVAPDHLGFGLSDKPRGWSYLPVDHAANLTRLIEALDLRDLTLIVQDWGGPTGLAYAIANPENVRNLVIMNTWLWPVDDDWYYRAFSGFMGGPVGRFLIRRFNFFVNSVMRVATGDQSALADGVHDHYRAPLATPNDREGSAVFPREIVGSTAWLRDLWARRDVLADKRALLLWGMKDIAFREKELNTWRELFPAAQVVTFPQTGHFVQEEQREALVPLVADFMAGEDVTAE